MHTCLNDNTFLF